MHNIFILEIKSSGICDTEYSLDTISEDLINTTAIIDGKLVITDPEKKLNSEDQEIIKNLDILLMNESDYKYYIGLVKMSKFAKEKLASGELVGTALNPQNATAHYQYQTVAGINYSLGWHIIETSDELAQLGFESDEINFLIDFQPFIINYSTGAVQSTVGKEMFTGTPDQIWKYTFNFYGDTIVTEGLLTGLTVNSTRSSSSFGDFRFATTPAPGMSQYIIDNYYKNYYNYTNRTSNNSFAGGVKLDLYSNILVTPVDQTKQINQKFSVSISFKAENDELGSCLLAISDLVGNDVCSVRIRNGLLTVITFNYNGTAERDYVPGDDVGWTVIDVSQYNNQVINLSIVAERGEKTQVYINGGLVSEFKSGSSEFTYNTFVIGDLRSGRGMKYVGNVYTFGLYGILLTPEQVQQNYRYFQKEVYDLNLNDPSH